MLVALGHDVLYLSLMNHGTSLSGLVCMQAVGPRTDTIACCQDYALSQKDVSVIKVTQIIPFEE